MKILLLFISLLAVSCGTDKTTETMVPYPVPSQPPPGGGGSVSFAAVKTVLETHCALSGCHANAPFLQSANQLAASNTQRRVTNNSMPPAYSPKYGQWTNREKALILTWFDERD